MEHFIFELTYEALYEMAKLVVEFHENNGSLESHRVFTILNEIHNPPDKMVDVETNPQTGKKYEKNEKNTEHPPSLLIIEFSKIFCYYNTQHRKLLGKMSGFWVKYFIDKSLPKNYTLFQYIQLKNSSFKVLIDEIHNDENKTRFGIYGFVKN